MRNWWGCIGKVSGRDRGAESCLPRQHRSAARINKIMNCFHLEGHGNAPQTAYPGPAVPCTTPPRGGTTKTDHLEPAINGHRGLLRQHPSELHLQRLPEPPTHDLTYTRSARASTSSRSTGFCVNMGLYSFELEFQGLYGYYYFSEVHSGPYFGYLSMTQGGHVLSAWV